MRVSAITLLIASTLSVTALADDRKDCADAYGDAQSLRDAHKLIEAKGKLITCSRAVCADFMVKDCTSWLGQIDAAIPGVVLSAKDDKGDISDVVVTVDGNQVTAHLDGSAVPVDPGPHQFVFTLGDGKKRETRYTVLEGQKTQPVTVSFASGTPSTQQPQNGAKNDGGNVTQTTNIVVQTGGPEQKTPGMRVAGNIFLGVGIVAAVLGGAFEGIALAMKGAADCDKQPLPGTTTTMCAPGALNNISTAATLSNVGLYMMIGGGVLGITGIVLIVASPKPKDASATKVGFQPLPGGSMFSLSRSF